MISSLIPVAVVLANLLIIVSSSQISDEFMSQLCHGELQPQQVYELLKSHPNKEEKIDFATVERLVEIRELEPKSGYTNWSAWYTCRWVKNSCSNIFKYCVDSYEKLLREADPKYHPKKISPEFMSQLCSNELQPHEVYKLLENHHNRRDIIGFTSVEELFFIGQLSGNDKDNLNWCKSVCRFGEEVCDNIERYCEDCLRRVGEFPDVSSEPSEAPMDIDDSQDKGGQKRASESTSTRLGKQPKLI